VASKLESSASAEEVAAEAKKRAEDAWRPEENDYSRHALRDMRAQSQKALEDQGHIADRESVDTMSRIVLDRARGVGVDEIQDVVNEVCPVVATIKLDDTV
jgi:predicted metal-dependent hydrolase